MRRRSAIATLTLAPFAALAAEKPSVAATFSILADLVSQVGGGAVSVATLVGPDDDVHV